MSAAPSIPFPANFRKPEDLADWLVLVALGAADQDGSAGDLERELKRLNCADSESLIGNVFTELGRREQSCSTAYPFVRKSSSVSLEKAARDHITYLFCLALSARSWKLRRAAPENPWLLFEEVATLAAQAYLAGEALLFGTSSRKGKKAKNVFRANVNALADRLREGEGFGPTKTFSSKDSHLDLVAWKPFGDQRGSQVVLFGQCAAGSDWRGAKLTELDPDSFWDQWMRSTKISSPLRSVFIPHRIFDDEEWTIRATAARLLFDRCRVVIHAHEKVNAGSLRNRLLQCCRVEWKLPV